MMRSHDIQFPLHNGLRIPALGFGTFANQGAPGETRRAVVHALRAGYRHLDCAWYYQNEDEVGDGIREYMAEDPGLKREDLFICTKVWNHLHEPDEVEWSLKNSLQKLQTGYVDLFLIHWPIAAEKEDNDHVKIGADGKYVIKKDLTENPLPTWRAMESLYEAGLAKAIGVSNWTVAGLERLLAQARVAPMVNQIEIHPFFPQDEMIAYLRSKNILAVAYSPLGSQDQVPGTGEKVFTSPELNAIAAAKGVTLAQVLIAWGLRRGYAVLPKSSNEARIRSNAHLIDLTDEEFEAVNAVAKGRKTRFVNMKDTFGYDVWPED